MSTTEIKSQTNISGVVKAYKALFPSEYMTAAQQVHDQRQNSLTKYGEFEKDAGMEVLDRALLTYPETLYYMFESKLDKEDFQYLSSKEGARWFGRTFPEWMAAQVM